MSDTPRTDKLATTLEDYAGYNEVIPADECRAIERELAELRKDKERLDWLIGDGGTIYTLSLIHI